jgi:hypothetical protein
LPEKISADLVSTALRGQDPAAARRPGLYGAALAAASCNAAGAVVAVAGAGAAKIPASAHAPFSPFTVSEDALGASASAPAAGAADAGRAADRKGWARIEAGFKVPYGIDDVWAFMADLPAVASCLRGAVLSDNDGERVKGISQSSSVPCRQGSKARRACSATMRASAACSKGQARTP